MSWWAGIRHRRLYFLPYINMPIQQLSQHLGVISTSVTHSIRLSTDGFMIAFITYDNII